MKPARITKKEKQEIARLKRNVQAKRRRLEKKGVPSNMLPNLAEIPDRISRKRLNEIKDSYKNFTSRSNMNYSYKQVGKDFVTTAEYNEMLLHRKRVNYQEQKLYKSNMKKPFRVISEEMQGLHPTKRTVGQDRHKPAPLVYSKENFKDLTDFREYRNKLERRINSLANNRQQFKDNMAIAAKNRFGALADEFVDIVNSMSVDDAIMLFETTDTFNLDYFYEGDVATLELTDEERMAALDFTVRDFKK